MSEWPHVQLAGRRALVSLSGGRQRLSRRRPWMGTWAHTAGYEPIAGACMRADRQGDVSEAPAGVLGGGRRAHGRPIEDNRLRSAAGWGAGRATEPWPTRGLNPGAASDCCAPGGA